jgi:hypothetical protein
LRRGRQREITRTGRSRSGAGLLTWVSGPHLPAFSTFPNLTCVSPKSGAVGKTIIVLLASLRPRDWVLFVVHGSPPEVLDLLSSGTMHQNGCAAFFQTFLPGLTASSVSLPARSGKPQCSVSVAHEVRAGDFRDHNSKRVIDWQETGPPKGGNSARPCPDRSGIPPSQPKMRIGPFLSN